MISHMATFAGMAAFAGIAALCRRGAGRWWGWLWNGAILGSLVACAVAPPAPTPLPRPVPAAPATAPPNVSPTPPVADIPRREPPPHPRAQWLPATFADLPGWADDRALALWPALRQSCARLPAMSSPAWSPVCARALANPPADDAAARAFLQRELQVWRIQSLDGEPRGLATGYFEPQIAASRLVQPGFMVPLHRPPADLGQRKPYWTREQQDTVPAARAALRGKEIAYVVSPLDALILQIQGSGRLMLTEPDGSQRLARLAFAGHNDQPYRSVGAWLIEQGELKPEGANWPAIRDWGQRAAPERVQQMLWANPRVVFFREETLAEPSTVTVAGSAAVAPATGPRGAQGVRLSAGRSVAVDPQAVPYGTALWLDTTEPLSAAPLRRLVMAQDTGSAITGAVRIDYFWGAGDNAEQQAGRMKQPLRLWALWPRDPP